MSQNEQDSLIADMKGRVVSSIEELVILRYYINRVMPMK